MADKAAVFILYAVFGSLLTIISIGLVFLPRIKSGVSTYDFRHKELFFSAITIILTTLLIRHLGVLNYDLFTAGVIFILTLVALRAMHSKTFVPSAIAGGLLSSGVCATLLYWMRADDGHVIINGGKHLLTFVIPWGISTYLLLSIRPGSSRASHHLWILLPFFALAGILIFSLSILDYFPYTYTYWHHWSAYIAPAEMVRAGLQLFLDIPAQYGAGMTALIATVCESECWTNTYFIFGLISLLYSIVIVLIGTTYKFQNITINVVILLGLLVSTVLYTAYPPNLQSVLATPSVGGSRFLILVVLSYWIVSKPTLTKPQIFITFIIWWLGVLWSPESAFCCTAVWFPLYILDHVQRNAGKHRSLINIGIALANLTSVTLLFSVISYLLYYLWIGDYPNLYYFWIYTIHPPAALAINPIGALWFAAVVILLSVVFNWIEFLKEKNYLRFRKSLVLQLMAYSATSYFLGRSHDNNILNLAPFYYLLLLDCLHRYRFSEFMTVFSSTCISFLICAPSQFGWTQWSRLSTVKSVFDFNISSRLSALSYLNEPSRVSLSRYAHRSPQDLYGDAVSLINIIKERGETYLIHDSAAVLQVSAGSTVWSSGHLMSTYHFMPDSVKIAIIRRGAERLNKSGWVIVANEPEFLRVLTIFDQAYSRSELIHTKTYSAVRFHPKGVDY
jgi:hypothetical protein